MYIVIIIYPKQSRARDGGFLLYLESDPCNIILILYCSYS